MNTDRNSTYLSFIRVSADPSHFPAVYLGIAQLKTRHFKADCVVHRLLDFRTTVSISVVRRQCRHHVS